MNKRTSFSSNLTDWYGRNARRLPWRVTRDPYKIWISEVMLQQTTVNAVIPYYGKWLTIFPTVEDLKRAPLEKVLKVWQGLGYYQRAKNLHKAARIICAHYEGKLPSEPEKLRKLPGFGPYTTGAVASIAFDLPCTIIDANVRRVVMRLLALDGYADTSQDQRIEEFLQKAIPSRNTGTFNQALMELGALICRNREPLCLLCPVKAHCAAHQKGIQKIIPKLKKKIIQDLDVAIGILQRGNKYLIQKRPSRGLLADLWEFPGGKIEKGETPQEALKRELKEELDIDITTSRLLMNVRHFYTQFRVNLHVFHCQPKSYPRPHSFRKWLPISRLTEYPMPSGNAKIVARLQKVIDNSRE
ncbi:MAG TPA: A/G-specific adenine glycosylase [Candidatus Omnitrophica bacterium]|nr:MAG: A/G-specific adenine glycosylase [Omnitrophica WOR_2 bacterium GWA2_53_43]HBO98146.1 A/G-specific adenine glycosylase [Candidatus Omnitrophota bacterium]HCI44206.1 A/G-specific adenine glycosylase [Candidatus Omnitrophota bacterium]